MAWKIEAILGDFRRLDITQELMHSAPAIDRLHFQADAHPLSIDWASVRFLRISNRELDYWRPMLVSPNCSFELRLDPYVDLRQTPARLVYFVNCYVNPRYMFMVTSQLEELRQTGILSLPRAALIVVSSGTESDRVRLNREITRILGESPNIQHEHTTDNQFEYPGIRKVWQLGQQDQQGYILYFHARGISRLRLGRFRRNRQRQEKRLFRRIIGEWRQNLTWLHHLTSVEKLGINSGGNGWVWFNFWWTRASYVRYLEEPAITDQRYYYEHWLGRYQPPGTPQRVYASDLKQCLSIASSTGLKKYNLGSDFNPLTGDTHLGLPFGYWKALMVPLLTKIRARFG